MQQQLDILILGHGGREKALARILRRSKRCVRLYADLVSPEEGVTAVSLDPLDFEGVAAFCRDNGIDLVVVGPEAPVVAGIRDYLDDAPGLENLKVIAPLAAAARLEGSKEYAKEFMAESGIPSPRFMPVDEDTLQEGLSFLDSLPAPYVIKADGLAGGRGVAIVDDLAEAKDILEDMVVDGLKGEAGRKVLIEEYVAGRECSVIVATDGEDYLALPVARDYKRLNDGDEGPNTPGMGAYSPVGFADDEFLSKVEKWIIAPTLRALKEREIDYQGFLYFGLMDLEGEPVLLEYNARLGDPEAQAILPRITSDFVDVLEGITDRTVGIKRVSVSEEASVAVVIMSKNDYMPVQTVSALGSTISVAAEKAYAEAAGLDGGEVFYRHDIAGEVKP